MIVHSPEKTVDRSRVRLSARIEPGTRGVRRFVPETLWYDLSEEWEPSLVDRLDGFAVAVLLLASSVGEDLELEGPISPRLAYGMEEYARVFHRWFPGRFHPIRVNADTAVSREPVDPAAVTTAFSGGVDSTFTLWSHLAARERYVDHQVTHGLFVHGFDISLDDPQTFASAESAYQALFRTLGLCLVPVRTNARDFAPGIAWELAHGAALISTALAVGGLHRRFFVPASTTYDYTGHWGTDPIIDHLLSTETLDVVHDGAHVHRAGKIAAISDWRPSYETLRVCWEKPDGLQNCCRCYNCIVTMCGLEAVGVLERYHTFPLPLRVEDVRAVEIPADWGREVDVIVAHLREKGRRDLAAALHDAVAPEAAAQALGAAPPSGVLGAVNRTLTLMRGLFSSALR